MSALSDLQVVDLSTGIAGPFCTKLFADFGADVIKVEPLGGGEARDLGPFPDDIANDETSGIFLYLNTNKRGVTLDIETEQGKSLLRKLIELSDVVVESFTPGYMEQLGFSYDTLEQIKPGIVLASITPFGQTGPWCHYQATDLIEYAVSGLGYVNGRPDREPLKEPGFESYYQGGASAFAGAMTALAYRGISGEGQHVDISIQEAAVSMFGPQFLGAMHSGQSPERGSTPLLPCKDGYVALNVRHDATWEYMWLFFGEPEMTEDARFATAADRRKHSKELEELLLPRLAKYTMEELFHGLAPLRILVGMTLDVGQLVHDPHLQERNFFVESLHPVAGSVTFPGAPFKMSETPWTFSGPAPLKGQHNEDIFCNALGYSREDLRRWQEGAVV